MIALSCLAASLLMATAVGGSLVAPAPRNVAVLPAIASFGLGDSESYDLELGLICPVTESYVAEALDAASGDVSFGGVTRAFSEAEYLIITFGSGTLSVSSTDNTELDGYPTLFVYSYDYGLEVHISLPDLSYWEYADDVYTIGVGFFDNDSFIGDNYGFYGRLSYSESSNDVIEPISFAELGSDVNPVTAITDGLTAVVPLGGALTDGFDAVFMDDGALTAVGMFAFILMGVGISVGITKKCFNWVTGRHGM